MSATIITMEDLQSFKTELLSEIKTLLGNTSNQALNKKWLKSGEVRQLLKISPGTLQNLRINGTLSFTRIGGTLYYNQESIQKILEQQ